MTAPTREPTEHLLASTVAESVSLLDAVREGRSRRLITALMLMSWAEQAEPQPAAKLAA